MKIWWKLAKNRGIQWHRKNNQPVRYVRWYVPNSSSCARVSNTRDGISFLRGARCQRKEKRACVHFSTVHQRAPPSRKACVTGLKLMSRVEAAKLVAILFFQNMRNLHVWHTPVISQFLYDFVWVKSNVSPRPSTKTYTRDFFDRTIPKRNLPPRLWAVIQNEQQIFACPAV